MGSGKGYSGPLLDLCLSVVRDYEARRDAKSGGRSAPPLTAWPPNVFDWGAQGGKASSDNHKTMAWCAGAALAALMRHEQPQRWEQRRRVLIDTYFPREFNVGPDGVGLWGREQSVVDPHTHQHLPGILARLAAVESGDPELLRLSEQWIDWVAIMMSAFSTPDGQFWPVGPRAPEGKPPLSFHGTAFNRLLRGFPGPLPQFEGEKGERNWNDSSAAGLRGLRYLQSVGDRAVNRHALDITTPLRDKATMRVAFDSVAVRAHEVTLKMPVTVYRGRDRFLAILIPGGPKNVGAGIPDHEMCDWVEVPYLDKFNPKATAAQVRFGYNWKTPPPKPPKDAFVVEFNSKDGRGKG